MPERTSLVRHAWIPVALESGQRVFVRPCDISQPMADGPHEGQAMIRIVTGRPDCDISLTEFLIGLLAVSCGPVSDDDWHARYRRPPSTTELEAAFAPFEPAMMLDGEGPRFFQDYHAFEGRNWPSSTLFCDSPGDNTIKENGDHFVKRERFHTLSRSGSAIGLLTLQSIAPSGGSGQYTALRGPGPISTIVFPVSAIGVAPTLWEIIWANVPKDFHVEISEIANAFPWMRASRTAADAGITTPEHKGVHKAQCFFGMPRRIRLNFSRETDGRACDFLGLSDTSFVESFEMKSGGIDYSAWAGVHPLTPTWKSKPQDQFRSSQLRSSRVGYRQWGDFTTSSDLAVPAKSVREFRSRLGDLSAEDKKRLRIFATGYVFKPGQATTLDFGEALLPLIITGDNACDAEISQLARNWVEAADNVASQLVSSVKRGLYGKDKAGRAGRDSTVLGAVKSRFWADTEVDFYAKLRAAADAIEAHKGPGLIDDIGELRQAAGQSWHTPLRRAALEIFDDTVPIHDAESARIEHVIEGRKMLGLMLAGHGKGGAPLFEKLSLPEVETKVKKGKKAA